MISKNVFPTYAQYNEDIILLALLHDIEKGFYVDVGANYPVVDSVTKLFYEKGWRGINIEPIPALFKQLQKERPADINLQVGVGEKAGELQFYENVHIPGHSSFSRSEAEHADSEDLKVYSVKIKTLEEIFKANSVKEIHFLKIDVEGFEEQVIRGNDWKHYRPMIVCIEANHRKTAWQDVLLESNYRLFITDGLNEYYIADEEWARTDNFAEKIVELSHQALKLHQYRSWKEDSRQLEKVTSLNQAHFDIVQDLRQQNERLRYENRFSLINKGYRDRLKTSLYWLTIGWLRQIRGRKQ